MIEKVTKEQLITSSSGWLSAFLNIIPGLGTGYIYQRRWRAYWITVFVSSLWLLYSTYLESGSDPSDPLSNNVDQSNFIGFLVIGIYTAFEAYFATLKKQKEQ